MFELNLRSFLSEFNGPKFIFYSSLLVFSVLTTLKLDGVLAISYFIVFSPLFFCEFLVFIGFIVGFFSFVICPPSRLDFVSRNDFFMMCFCTLEHVLLFMFELLCCLKLNSVVGVNGEPISWLLVFSPFFVQSFIAMIISVWCIRHDKSFEFEMFFSINVVQFVFIAFKLDRALHWTWLIVFVPTWAMFALFLVGTFYSIIISIFLSRSLHFHAQRRSHLFSTVCYFLISVPLLAFFVLLVGQLDASASAISSSASSTLFDQWFRQHRLPYAVVGLPLFVALLFLVALSFGSRGGNTWWFAMRKPFCNFVFDAFPCLRQYANISYKFGYDGASRENVARPAGEAAQALLLRNSRRNVEDGGDRIFPTNVQPQRLGSRTLHKTPTFTSHTIEAPD